MNTKSAPQELEDIQRMDMAAEWVLLLRQESVPDEDIARWLQWCEADPRNQQAFDRAQKLLNLTRALRPQDIDADVAARRPSPQRSVARLPLLQRLRRLLIGGPPQRYRAVPRLAVMFGVAALAGSALWTWHTGIPVPEQTVVAAQNPVHTTLLPDGSRMELASKTTVAVNFTPQQRALELQDGEAYFTVAPNKQRPFVVAAGRVRVRAVGTAFNVRRAGERVVVTVTKGSVDVYQSDEVGDKGGMAHPMEVAAGGQLIWGPDAAAAVVAAVDPSVALAWREGRLEYAGEPFDAVIADINRYSRRPVLIGDESVKKLRFTGTVLTNSTEEWLRALPGNFPVRLEDQGKAVVIRAKGSRAAG